MAATPTRLLGKVKSVADGVCEVSEKRGTFTVALGIDAAYEVHRVVPITEAAQAGKSAWLLAREQPKVPRESGPDLPPQIVNVVTAVFADSFTPPPVPDDLAAKKVKWLAGHVSASDKEIRFDSTTVQVGRDRKVLLVEAAAADAVQKGRIVFVDGQPEGGEKAKRLKAKRVAVIAPDLPAVEYRAILGM